MTSIANRLIIGFVRLAQVKRLSENDWILERAMTFQRKAMPGRLPERFRRRYDVREHQVGGHSVYTIGPREHVRQGRILYIHGGAYLFDILCFHWKLVAELIDAIGCVFTVPLYPLAPEHRCLDALAMVLDVYREVVASTNPEKIIIMGDSAGGGLSLALAQGARRAGLPQPSRIVLLSPWLDVTMTNPDIASIASCDPLLSTRAAVAVGRLYAGDLDVKDSRVSPLYGPLEGLAPITLFTGRRDILNPDARRLRDEALQCGTSFSLIEAANMMHAWMLLPSPEGRLARKRIASLLASFG